MAKKQKQTTDEIVEVIVPDEEKATEQTPKAEKKSKKEKNVETPKSTKEKDIKSKDTKDKNSKDSKNKSKPKKERKSLKKRFSEIWSELKKVSKPSFGKVVKNTCIVISVVAICTILLFGVDRLFEFLFDLLMPNS